MEQCGEAHIEEGHRLVGKVTFEGARSFELMQVFAALC